MKQLLSVLLLSLTVAISFAQVQEDATIYYSDPEPLENKSYKISIDEAYARSTSSRMEITVQNKSASYLICNWEESIFNYGSQSYAADPTYFFIPPSQSTSGVVSTSGNKMSSKAFNINFNGFYTVDNDFSLIVADDFKIISESSKGSTGDFAYYMTGIKCIGSDATLTFKVKNMGIRIGVLQPAALLLRLEDGHEYKNTGKSLEPVVLFPDHEEIVVCVFNVQINSFDNISQEKKLIWNAFFTIANVVGIDGAFLKMGTEVSGWGSKDKSMAALEAEKNIRKLTDTSEVKNRGSSKEKLAYLSYQRENSPMDIFLFKNETEFNVEFGYQYLQIVGFLDEDEYLASGGNDKEMEPAGDVEVWKKRWYSNRNDFYEPIFVYELNKAISKKEGVNFERKNPTSNFTCRIEVLEINHKRVRGASIPTREATIKFRVKILNKKNEVVYFISEFETRSDLEVYERFDRNEYPQFYYEGRYAVCYEKAALEVFNYLAKNVFHWE